jgi:L-aspartate oxidase
MTDSIRVPRYLVSFDPKRVMHYFTDIFILGGGLAGLRSALAVDPQLATLVVTKDEIRESNSNYAQGGIATVMAPTDSFDSHVEDTMTAGGALCDREVVEMVVRAAPQRVNELIAWGTNFDSEQGELLLGREGGHEHNRILHAMGDATGQEIMRSVIAKTSVAENIQVWENTFTLDLLVDEGCCVGALLWHPAHGKMMVWAKQTILCTGGAGQLYRETTNPDVATGDGHAMAFRAGVCLRDMEFVQFHPTVLYIAGSSRSLITEAVRGEGAHLVDANGDRFMPAYDDRAELAPRDVVSQSIAAQMKKTRHPNVYLQLSHLDPNYVRNRFPGIARLCAEFGLDIATDRIPVRPGAHYMIGGVTVDKDGRTSLPGLWGAGEVTSSGLHGANRLASNSLLEGIVYGVSAGRAASQAAAAMPDALRAVPLASPPRAADDGERVDLIDIRNSLQSLIWRAAGVQRHADELEEARKTIDGWCKYALSREVDNPTGWEIQNLLVVARLVIEAARCRQESRGVHLRADFPDRDDVNWKRHSEFRMDRAAAVSS